MQDNSALYDLISNIQAKLNDDNTSSSTQNTTEETINNSSDTTQNLNQNTTENFNTNNETNTNANNNNFDFSNLDMNTILKMQSLFSKFNRSTPKKNLLYSLKPFLNQTRQDKLGEYITILSIMDALDIFGKKGSDN